jgi:hypothetical protein
VIVVVPGKPVITRGVITSVARLAALGRSVVEVVLVIGP